MNNMDSQTISLFSQYFEETLTDSDAAILLTILDNHPQWEIDFAHNSLTHFLLQEVYEYRSDKKRGIKFEFKGGVCVPDGKDKNSAPELLIDNISSHPVRIDQEWERLIEIQNQEKAIDHSISRPRKNELDDFGPINENNNSDNSYDPFAIYREEEARIETARRKEQEQSRLRKKWKWNDYLFVTTVLAALLLATVTSWKNSQQEHSTESDWNSYRGLARVTDVVDPVFVPEKQILYRGQELLAEQDEIHLRSGIIRLEYINGATVILNGPTHYKLKSSLSAFCPLGQLSVVVPPTASGFQITTPFGKAIDRGTEFFLQVLPEKMNLEVVQGIVDLSLNETETYRLFEGIGNQIFDNGKRTSHPVDLSNHITQEIFLSALQKYSREEQKKKEKRDLVLDTDPSLLARFDFMKVDKKEVLNSAQAGLLECPSLQLTKCREIEGNLYETRAVSFQEQGSLGTFHLQKKLQSMTLVAYVRIDRLRGEGNVLLASSQKMDSPGEFVWQIVRDSLQRNKGRLQMQIVSGKQAGPSVFNSEIFLSPRNSNIWMQLAVVVNAKTKTIRHYQNGNLISENPWPNQQLLKFSEITIGNIRLDMKENERNLQGAFGEIRLYNRPLSKQQLLQLL